MKKNKKITIVMSIIITVAIIIAVFAYLFIATDIFKSEKELFAKYISQTIELLEKNVDTKMIKTYNDLRNEKKYESNLKIKTVHSEGGEISNPLNNLSGKIDVQKDEEQKYFYMDAQILYDNENYLKAEIIKEEDLYGFRLTDVVKQFLTLKKDENIESIANDIGIDSNDLETILNLFDSTQELELNKKIETTKNEYSELILKEVEKGNFEKQKNIMIPTENGEVKGNSYTVSLKSEQVKEILTNIFKDINEQTEIPSVRVTVFESKQKTIRTLIEILNHQITIENNENIKIEYTNNETLQTYNFEIRKEFKNDQEEFNIIADIKDGEQNYQIIFSSIVKEIDNEIELVYEISHKQEITTISLELENKIFIGNEFEKKETLNSNKLLINSLKQEKRTELIELLKQIIPQKIEQRLNLIEQRMWPPEEKEQENNGESQVEINKFNAKFEFYTGNQVSTDNIKALLDTVKNNLNSYEQINNEQQEDGEKESKLNIKLNIEKGIVNEEAIREINEKISDAKKYKVEIFYKQENGMIDYIIISEK